MLNWLMQHYALFVAIAACAALAMWRGGPAERIGAGANLAAAVAWFIARHSLTPESLKIMELAVDGLLALTFLVLSLRYASLWLGGALLLQAVQFSLHSYYFVTEKEADRMFAVVSNVVSFGVVVLLLVGVGTSWRKRTLANASANPAAA